MSAWRLAQVDQILQWAESGQLNARQVARLAAVAPLHVGRAAWLAAGGRFCTFAGVLLLALAVVFFFAYNWDDLSRFGKLALAAAALTGCVAAAWASRPDGRVWQAALFGAALCTGALLALIGQTYQTGSDIWELFAAWTALMLPFVLLARASAAWLLCLLVSNLCLTRMLMQDGVWLPGVQGDAAKLALWVLLNVLWWLAGWRGGRWLLAQPSRYLERVGATLVLAGLTLGAMMGVFAGQSRDAAGFVVYVPVFMAAAGTGFWFYQHRRFDLVMLGVLSVASVVAATSVLVRLFLEARAWALGFFVIAGFVVLASGYGAMWLKKLARQHGQQDRASDIATSVEPQP